jgi:hypothetical protein
LIALHLDGAFARHPDLLAEMPLALGEIVMAIDALKLHFLFMAPLAVKKKAQLLDHAVHHLFPV